MELAEHDPENVHKLVDIRSAHQVEHAHPNAEDGDEGGKAVADDRCAAQDAAESGLVRLHEAGVDSADVGGGADEEEHDDDHAVEAEEGALGRRESTITCDMNNYNDNTHHCIFIEVLTSRAAAGSAASSASARGWLSPRVGVLRQSG